jgi:hypothetical protein
VSAPRIQHRGVNWEAGRGAGGSICLACCVFQLQLSRGCATSMHACLGPSHPLCAPLLPPLQVNWFYKSQIQAEENFKRKKSKQQQQYRERLERLMGAKEKHLEFDPSIDFDKLSIASSELSELDSDVHSLSSLKSCADSWILDAEYKKPAEGWIRAACLQLAWVSPFEAHGCCFMVHQVSRSFRVCRVPRPAKPLLLLLNPSNPANPRSCPWRCVPARPTSSSL